MVDEAAGTAVPVFKAPLDGLSPGPAGNRQQANDQDKSHENADP
jgi:hypothetical protein